MALRKMMRADTPVKARTARAPRVIASEAGRRRMDPLIPELHQRLTWVAINYLSPLAGPADAVRSAGTPAERLRRLLEFSYCAARFLAYVGFADAAARGASDSEKKDLAKILGNPAFGKLLALVARFGAEGPGRASPRLLPRLDAYIDLGRVPAFERLVQVRNDLAHYRLDP